MIIGLVSRAHGGKDTVGDHLVKNHGFKRVAFADKLKEHLIKHFGFTEEDVNVTKDEFYRKCAQGLGECVRSEVDKDYWIHAALDSIDDEDNIVFTDVRYLNEAKTIKYLGGFLIRIVRPGSKDSISHGKDHVSETEQSNIEVDRIICNVSTIESLCHMADYAVESLNNKGGENEVK